jgi:hypothetical protein
MLAFSAHAEVEKLFPKMDGWEPEGEPMVYTADNLFEYINGSADLYLTYDFKEMGTLSYFDDQGRGITVDIYRHGDNRGSFGIYTQERPSPANLKDIGAEGYYDYGVLNFYRGPYYVKILGYDLESFDEDMLTVVAKIISANIGGEAEKPEVLSCFPTDAMVEGSVRYIARNLWGHGFLHSAFVARYRADNNTNTTGIIIEASDAADADKMLQSYLGLVTEKGGSVAEDNGVYRFDDPVSKTAGTLSLKKAGNYIWGLSAGSETTANAYIASVESNLKDKGLLQ